jgi:hypothetical protein
VPSLTGDFSGHWTQDEYQKLFDLVNLDLRKKSHQNKNPDNRKVCYLPLLIFRSSFHGLTVCIIYSVLASMVVVVHIVKQHES